MEAVLCKEIRRECPLILNITNDVAKNFSANALLAVGSSPIMSDEPEEMKDLVGQCSALVVNIGTLSRRQAEAMRIAAGAANAAGKPWILDPVGVGASSLRMLCAQELSRLGPSIIRGNASEIIALCCGEGSCRGVDSCNTTDSLHAIQAGKALAKATGAVVSISGETDYITDGEKVESVSGGSPLMKLVTAMGCTASAISGAFAAVDSDPFSAAVHAMTLLSRAGEKAAELCAGPGTFAPHFIDALSTL